MSERLIGGRRLVIRARINAGERWLCALWDDGEIIHAAINDWNAAIAIVHAEHHAERGISAARLCALDCKEV